MSPVTQFSDTIFFILGLLILYKNQFPLRGTRVITGRSAQVMGVCWLVPAIADALGLYYLTIAAWVVFILSVVTARWVEVEKLKHKRQPLPDVLTVSEAARYLKVEEVYILHLIEDGELQAKAVGGEYRISSDALQAFLDS